MGGAVKILVALWIIQTQNETLISYEYRFNPRNPLTYVFLFFLYVVWMFATKFEGFKEIKEDHPFIYEKKDVPWL